MPSTHPGSETSARSPRLELFLASVTLLFLELALIRWIGSEVRLFAYLQNSILIACLMGMGMGCFAHDRPIRFRLVLVPIIVVALPLAVPGADKNIADLSVWLATFVDFHVWAGRTEMNAVETALALGVGVLLVVTVLLSAWLAFLPLGQVVAAAMNREKNPVAAYSINVGASLAGVGLFALASGLRLSPVYWLAAASLGLILTIKARGESVKTVAVLALILVGLAGGGRWFGDAGTTIWSPYQKLETFPLPQSDEIEGFSHELTVIGVNNIPYQTMMDMRPETLARSARLFGVARDGLSQYDLPLRFKRAPERVLIVGAGSGNDVAGAIRNGAQSVVAVEIDPVIVELGRKFHPERPYDSPKVEIVIDDARAYFARSRERFDLIVFGLLDSHTTGAMTNTRLDNYVYTQESIEMAKRLLKPEGVISLAFEANRSFLARKLHAILEQAFAGPPLAFKVPNSTIGMGGTFFIVGHRPTIEGALAADKPLADYVRRLQAENPLDFSVASRIPTDDWPYLYLDTPHIPPLFLILAALMGGIFLACSRWLGMTGSFAAWRRPEWHFFFMGAAFMLLEVAMMNRSAVALGSTWIVNAAIISGILAMILAANLVKTRWPDLPARPIFFGLIGACLLLYALDPAWIAGLPYGTRVAAVAGLLTFPMFFSGLVFIDSFARAPDRGRALGANLFGALVGGFLQSLSFLIGMKALVLAVALLYLLAVLSFPARTAAPEALPEKA